MGDELLTIDETAAKLRVSRRTVWGWIGSGVLRALRVGPRTTRVERTEVERLISDARARGARLTGGRS